jgi:hypothetical protein
MDKDLARTFPSLRKFAAAEGQEALGRVLRAYAALDPEVGGGGVGCVCVWGGGGAAALHPEVVVKGGGVSRGWGAW